MFVREQAEKELRELNATLENRVLEATGDLERRNEELARSIASLETFNRLAVGREERIIELKEKVNALSRELGRSEPYDLSEILGASRGDHGAS